MGEFGARSNAPSLSRQRWLQPIAELYGGWESAPTWADIHCQGHTLGPLSFSVRSDVRCYKGSTLQATVRHIVGELRDCQVASRTGLLTTFPEGNGFMDAVLTGKKYTRVPWYTSHKVYAGLRCKRIYQPPPAPDVLVRFCDWAVMATHPLTDEQFQTMLEVEHGHERGSCRRL